MARGFPTGWCMKTGENLSQTIPKLLFAEQKRKGASCLLRIFINGPYATLREGLSVMA